MAASEPVPPQQEAPLGFGARVLGVFVSPTQTFADIVRRPSFIPPLVLLTLFSIVSSALIVNRVGLEQIVRNEVMKNPRVAELPAEQRERAVEQGIAIGRVTVWLGPALGPLIVALVIAGVLLLVTNFVLGGEVRFPTMLSVAAYGFLPGLLLSVAAIITAFLKDPADVDVQNPVISNLGPLFDPASHKVLYRLATSIDVFSFWQIALLGLGIAAAARFSFRKGVLAVLIPWSIYVLGAAGFRALF